MRGDDSLCVQRRIHKRRSTFPHRQPGVPSSCGRRNGPRLAATSASQPTGAILSGGTRSETSLSLTKVSWMSATLAAKMRPSTSVAPPFDPIDQRGILDVGIFRQDAGNLLAVRTAMVGGAVV